ncbi:MAG: 5-oxoprolinase subunit PxpB [Synergistaceae bacterium]|jgi:KipI family sensor histidine kinase inhibitor|nr:5-oxoprolinase subunit PxpB [Synergistaceae bacterium]
MYDVPKLLGSGDSCLVVEFSPAIEMEANIRLQCLRRVLADRKIRGVREFVPTYRSLSIHYDPLRLSREKLEGIVSTSLEQSRESAEVPKRVLVMPVVYGGEYGPDMANVSSHTGFDEDGIIRRHTSVDYYCYMLGFTPGFSYLGGLDEALATPRLSKPRTLIPAGSVGIAGKQTGAYSIDSPGGWQLIGRTPLRLFDPNDEENPTLIDAGDWIRFKSVTETEYRDIERDVSAGKYRPERFVERNGGDMACRS